MFKGLCCVTNAVLPRAAGSRLHFAGRDGQAPHWEHVEGAQPPRGLLVSPLLVTRSEKGRGETVQNHPVPLDVTQQAQEGPSTQSRPLMGSALMKQF